MNNRWRVMALALLVATTVFLGGCRFDFPLSKKEKKPEPPSLLKVEIHFTDGEILTGYVKELAVAKDGVVYVGGSSANYLYDSKGKVIGVFNYARVLYMKILE